MAITKEQRNSIIEYLLRNTTYDEVTLCSKPDGQLYNIKKKTEECLSRYPLEIFEYYKNNPHITPRYTLEELRALNFNELSELRRSLNIKKTKQKVTAEHHAGQMHIDGIEHISELSTSKLAASIIISNEEQNERDYFFLTREEAYEMYGEDITDEFLETQGFKLYEPLYRDEKDEDEEKLYQARNILKSNFTINGVKPSIEDLCSLETTELMILSSSISHLSKRIKTKRLNK